MTAHSLAQIKNRREFAEAFDAAMSGAHERLRTLWHFEKDQNLPKSYLIEFHPNHNGDHTHEWAAEDVFKSLVHAGRRAGSTVKRTQEDSLLYVHHAEASHEAEFIVDCFDTRFLTFHTISNAVTTDRFIFDRLTQYNPEFDLFWFPVSLLEDVKNRERVTGWEAYFDPLLDTVEEASEDAESHEDEGDPNHEFSNEYVRETASHRLRRPRINIHLEIADALETYEKLRNVPNLLPDVPLSSVLAERHDEARTYQARAKIKSTGKITGKGNDFSSYQQIVDGTKDSYAALVRALEKRYWLRTEGYTGNNITSIKVAGEPFCVHFKSEIDVRALLTLMFSCTRPFRLMGEFEEIGKDYFVVDAIDLHVNQPLAFEISPELMRIYLYEGTCGNTLVRIVRSLQHYIDSRLKHPELAS